jgi:hypothetical protein
MIVKGQILNTIIDNIKAIGAAKIDTDNIIIYNDGEKLRFGASSRDTIVIVNDVIQLTKENSISFTGAISININTLSSAVSDSNDCDVSIEVSKEDVRYLTISTPVESYNIGTLPIGDKDIENIFNRNIPDLQVLFENISISTIRPISTMIANIGSLCPDNQFKTILYRNSNNFQAIFVTATTMSSFETTLPNTPEDKKMISGIETKSPIVPSSINIFINKLKDTDNISISCSPNIFKITSSIGTLISTFSSLDKPIMDSVNAFNQTKANILAIDKKMMSIKISPKILKKAINKASILVSKSKFDQMSSYIPITIPDEKSISIAFKSASGSYSTTMNTGIDASGISKNPGSPSVLAMCIPIMNSILSTMEDTSANNRTIIEARETDDDKIFVRITPEAGNKINYFIRLRK